MISPSAGLLGVLQLFQHLNHSNRHAEKACWWVRDAQAHPCQEHGHCSHDHRVARVMTPFYWEEVKAHRAKTPSLLLPTAPAHPLFGKCHLWEARRDCNLEITLAGVWASRRTINYEDLALSQRGPSQAGCLHACSSVWGLQIRVRC